MTHFVVVVVVVVVDRNGPVLFEQL